MIKLIDSLIYKLALALEPSRVPTVRELKQMQDDWISLYAQGSSARGYYSPYDDPDYQRINRIRAYYNMGDLLTEINQGNWRP